jgi:glutamate synthase (NADPH/NADH) small chain
MEGEGVLFRLNANVGVNVPVAELRQEYDALVLTGGATQARDLPIPGRDLAGVHFAMDFLPQQNKRNQGDAIPSSVAICAQGKHVIVIGGGDTGSDCTGTSNRQGAASVTQFELLAMPPDLGDYPRRDERPTHSPWPYWTMMLRTSSSHEEGCNRHWSVLTKEFRGDEQGRVQSLVTVTIEWSQDDSGRQTFKEVPGTQQEWPCQLALLAMGFLGPEKKGAIEELGLALDPRGNVQCDERYMSSVPGVFAAGDMRRGQSLVVWAIPGRRSLSDGGEPPAQRQRRRLRLALRFGVAPGGWGKALACPSAEVRGRKSEVGRKNKADRLEASALSIRGTSGPP